jgi:hypothetical protein
MDRHCNIGLDRHPAPDPVLWGSPRVWVVTIHAARVPGAKIFDSVRGLHPALNEAIRLAVEQAEARGWHLSIAR